MRVDLFVNRSVLAIRMERICYEMKLMCLEGCLLLVDLVQFSDHLFELG